MAFVLQHDRMAIQLNVYETKQTAQVPGFTEQDIDLRVDSQRLYITGKHEESSKEKKEKSVYSEWQAKQLFREFDLPTVIDPDKVKAHVKNGVLEITMPKREKTKKIDLAETS